MADDLPIACTLTPEALRERRAALLPGLRERAVSAEPRDDGYRLRFDAGGDVLGEIARVVDTERKCCRFLRFELVVEPDGGPVWLVLSGPPGTREFLAGLFDSEQRPI